jgi:hypothetical protein
MGGKQLGFSDYELTTAKKQTKREKFLSEMEAVVPWQALIELIEPHYPKASKKGLLRKWIRGQLQQKGDLLKPAARSSRCSYLRRQRHSVNIPTAFIDQEKA